MPQSKKVYVGIDIHKETAWWSMVDKAGRVLEEGSTPMVSLEKLAKEKLGRRAEAVVETTGNCYYAVDQLKPHVSRVVLANTLAMHDRTRAKRKTDKLDARSLAKALAANFVAEVWIPPAEVREQREFNSHRHALGHELTDLKNRMMALFHRHGKRFKGKDLFSSETLGWIEEQDLPSSTKQILASNHRRGMFLKGELEILDRQIAEKALGDEECVRLMTMPGLGAQAAMILKGEIGDISRFESPKKLASYSGLVPSVRASAGKGRTGPITKKGRKQLRWIMVEAANAAVLSKGIFRERYERLRRRGLEHGTALVAVARQMLEMVWHLMSKESPFRGASWEFLVRKFRVLMARAHGRCPRGAASAVVRATMGWSVNPDLRAG